VCHCREHRETWFASNPLIGGQITRHSHSVSLVAGRIPRPRKSPNVELEHHLTDDEAHLAEALLWHRCHGPTSELLPQIAHQRTLVGKVRNINGGAIAVGHPFGMTGAQITSTLINSLQYHDKPNQKLNREKILKFADLKDQTIIMSGGSRGIGLATAKALSTAGCNVAILSKTDEPHEGLPGTIHTAVEEIRQCGGDAIGVVGDVRSEDDVTRLVDRAIERFGKIDAVINNASAIHLAGTLDTPMKRFTLMNEVNVRGTWLLTNKALPHMLKTGSGRILTLSPPLNLASHWLARHPAYTVSKYSMTMLTLSWAAELGRHGIAACALWPATLIDTAAVRNVVGGGEAARSPAIMADAALALFGRSPEQTNGRTYIDADVLREEGVRNLSVYGGGAQPAKDLFVD